MQGQAATTEKPKPNKKKNLKGEEGSERLILNYQSAFNLATNTMYCATKIVPD